VLRANLVVPVRADEEQVRTSFCSSVAAYRGWPHHGLVEDRPTDEGDHGVIMMILNADLSRQFEFVQQGRMVIEGDPRTNTPPYFCSHMPTLVETRGGDYFFVPSMTCLRMIGFGIIDPT
jgi:hypothetical protein